MKEVNLVRGMLAIAVVSFAVGCGSLYMSYFYANSLPWTVAFGAMFSDESFPKDRNSIPTSFGWIYEAARLLIGLFAAGLLLGMSFWEDFRRLADYKPSKRKSLTRAFQWAFVLMALVVTLVVAYYHFELAPRALQTGQNFWTKWVQLPGTAPAEEFNLESSSYTTPYLYYFPYSITLYLTVWLPVLVTTVYGVTSDLCDLSEEGRNRQDSKSCKQIIEDFKMFAERTRRLVHRYGSLFLLIVCAISFEYHFSKATLAPLVQKFMYFAYVASGASLVVLFGWFAKYEKQRSLAVEKLLAMHCEESLDQFHSTKIWLSTMRQNVFFLVGVAILSTFFGPAADLLKLLLGK